MKILFIDLKYDYGDKARGINHIGQDGFKESLEQLEHKVESFYYDAYLSDTRLLQLTLIEFAEQCQPDLIFFNLFKDQFDHSTIRGLSSKFTTINWFGDDQWRFESFTKYYANDFTWCITTDLFSVEKYKSIGQCNVIYSQWAAINSHALSQELFTGYKYDVTFVGGYHPYRHWFIKQLRNNGVRVEAYGYGWPNGPLSFQQMNIIFRDSKINLNISNSNSFDLSYLSSSLKALILAFRSKKSTSQIKARNFEIPYFGGFQLSDYVPSLESYFEIGKEVVCYSSPEEAALQIQYYLTNDELRESIRHAGYKRATNEHGYIHRIKNILKQIT